MSFEKLRVYQAAELLDKMVVDLIALMPRGFARDIDQLKRAGASILYNIAEAYGNNGRRKVLQLEIARGSADETRAILRRVAARGGLPRALRYKSHANLTVSIAKMLTAWIDGLS